jgi:hypothetical protein
MSVAGGRVSATLSISGVTESFILIENPGINIGSDFPKSRKQADLPDMTCEEYKQISNDIFSKLDNDCQKSDNVGTTKCRTNLEKALVSFFLGDNCANEYYDMENGGSEWSSTCRDKNIYADLARYNKAADLGMCGWKPSFIEVPTTNTTSQSSIDSGPWGPRPPGWPPECSWPLKSNKQPPSCWPVGMAWPPPIPFEWPPHLPWPPIAINNITSRKKENVTYNIFNGYGGWDADEQESNWGSFQKLAPS